MMNIMMISACPERQEMVQRPRELVSRVRIDSLEEPQHDPYVHGQDVQILGDGAPDDRAANCAEAEEKHLDRASVFGGQAKRRRVLVVDLVDHLVEARGVQGAVQPVVPCVFHDEEDGDLVGHGEEGGEGHSGGEAAELGERVEEPDLGEFDCEVGEEDELSAVPLFGNGGEFLL